MDKGTQRVKYEPEGEVRGRLEKRDQKASTAARPNQNMDCFARYKGQINSHGKTKADRDGKIIFLLIQLRLNCFFVAAILDNISSIHYIANGAIQSSRTRNKNESLLKRRFDVRTKVGSCRKRKIRNQSMAQSVYR